MGAGYVDEGARHGEGVVDAVATVRVTINSCRA